MTRHEMEQAIAHDLELCAIGIALTKGKARKKYEAHRKSCIDQLAEWNKQDGYAEMTLEEIFAELEL